MNRLRTHKRCNGIQLLLLFPWHKTQCPVRVWLNNLMRYMQITGTHNGASIQLIVVVVVVLIKVRHHQLRQKKREKRERVNGNQTQSLRKWSAQSVRCRQGEDANCSNCDAVIFPVGQLTTDHTCWFFNGKPLELHAKKSLIIPNWPQVKSIDWQQWQVMAGKNTHHVQQEKAAAALECTRSHNRHRCVPVI